MRRGQGFSQLIEGLGRGEPVSLAIVGLVVIFFVYRIAKAVSRSNRR